jgi:ribonuclease HI
VIQVRLFTDAVVGKNCPGGVGFVLLSEEEKTPFYYEHKHPIPDGMSQVAAELYGILSGLESIEHVLFSHSLRAKDVFMNVYTDCRPAIHAIRMVYERKEEDDLTRILCKRILRLVSEKYAVPPGGGADWNFLSAKKSKVPRQHRRFHAHMVRAHELSRAAKAAFRGLL